MKKIFIAEDDNFLANAYRLKLTKAGFDVKIMRDGQELIDLLKTDIPDLIILDIIMPVKDGFITLQELKANKSWSTIPVIIASNLGQKEDVDKAMQLGANDFIVKSDLSLVAIMQKINLLLTQKSHLVT
jgi:two-component system, OmpR family, alkaline phosphatase synthesis response regulator PhoP